MKDISLGRVETVDELREALRPIRDDMPLVDPFDITLKEVDPFGMVVVIEKDGDDLARQARSLPEQPAGTVE